MKVAVLVALACVCASVDAKSIQKRDIFDFFRDRVDDGIDAVGDVIDAVGDSIDTFRDRRRELWETIKDAVRDIDTSGIRDRIEDRIESIRDRVKETVIDDVIDSTKTAISSAAKFMQFDDLVDEVKELMDSDSDISEEDLEVIVAAIEDTSK